MRYTPSSARTWWRRSPRNASWWGSRTEIPDRRRVGQAAAALGAFKAAMAVRGIITDARTNPPLPPLVDTEVKAIAAVLDELGLGRSA